MHREVNVYSLPQHFEPDELRGGIAVVIDVLRASTTIVAALANGAQRVIPCGDVEAAKRIAAGFPRGEAVLGGERRGVRIDGFDLDNSPAAYTLQRVGGKALVFTTTNGTAALLRSRTAERVLIGSLNNRRAVVEALARDGRPAHFVCAGTDERATAEDLLAAGAIAAGLEAAVGGTSSRDDMAVVAKELWSAASSTSGGLRRLLRQSRGGRNLIELGFDADIDWAVTLDSVPLLAEYFPKTADVRTVR